MVRWLICIGLYAVFVPRGLVHAIPPPDLLVSVFQSLLATLGIIAASLVLAYSAVKNYLQALLSTRTRQLVFMSVLAVSVAALVWSLYATEKQSQFNTWQAGVDAEIRNVWEQYQPVYDAADENAARETLQSAATEVTWAAFQDHVGDRPYQIIDIRDVHAYQVGRFASSTHIRLADLLRGEWEALLPYRDQPIYLVCFLGTTGSIAADFLASKGFTDLYIPQDGLRATLRRDPVPFIGEPSFPYHHEMIDRLSQAEVAALQADGAQIIDVRSPNFYDTPTAHQPDLQFFREFQTTTEIETFVASLDAAVAYVSLCNSEASCFQGEMLLHDLRAGGRTAAGTYDVNQPAGKKWWRPTNYVPES